MSSHSELRSAGQREEKHALQTLYLEATVSTRSDSEYKRWDRIQTGQERTEPDPRFWKNWTELEL